MSVCWSARKKRMHRERIFSSASTTMRCLRMRPSPESRRITIEYDSDYPPIINEEMHNDPTRILESAELASAIQDSLVENTGALDRGVRRNTFAVLRETAIPAVLLELGYMSSPTELAKLTTSQLPDNFGESHHCRDRGVFQLNGSLSKANSIAQKRKPAEIIDCDDFCRLLYAFIFRFFQACSAKRRCVKPLKSVMTPSLQRFSFWKVSRFLKNGSIAMIMPMFALLAARRPE